MMLSVSPSAHRIASAPRIDNGIEIAMIAVERQLPRKIRIIRLVSAAAMMPSWITPLIAAEMNSDWSPISEILRLSGRRP
jgi:hypothetical protein